MPDWTEIVKMRLGPLGLDPERETEIIEELAAHLEDLYEGFRRQGIGEPEAFERAVASVNDWRQLRREILFSERGAHAMRYRAYHVLMPALLAGAFSIWLPYLFWLWGGILETRTLCSLIIFLAVALSTGGAGIYWFRRLRSGKLKPDQRQYIWMPGLFAAAFYLSSPYLLMWTHIGSHFGTSWIIGKLMINLWYSQLIALVPVGAMVAYWSRTAGGTRKHQILAATYPSLVWGVIFLWICSSNLYVGYINLHSLASILAAQVVLPGLALLLGALPCLVGSSHKPSEHGVAHLAHS